MLATVRVCYIYEVKLIYFSQPRICVVASGCQKWNFESVVGFAHDAWADDFVIFEKLYGAQISPTVWSTPIWHTFEKK